MSREYAVQQFAHRVVDYIHWRSKITIETLADSYWSVFGGEQSITIDGVTASFPASPASGGDTIRGQLRAEGDLLRDLLNNLNPDDEFVDIGANLGLHSLFAAQVCDHVLAVEPHPDNAAQLRQTVADAPVTVVEAAVSDTDGEQDFDGGGGVGRGDGGLGGGETTVRTVRGDTLVAEQGVSPDIVKIDVEGAEGLVLEGMRETLSEVRRIYCEVHLPAEHRRSIRDYGWTPAEFLMELSELGSR